MLSMQKLYVSKVVCISWLDFVMVMSSEYDMT